MSQASDALQTAQQELADFKANPPPEYVTEDIVSGDQKFTPAYTARLGQLEATVREYQRQANAEAAPPKPAATPASLTTAPTQGSQADIKNQQAQQKIIDDQANRQAQLELENKRLGVQEATQALAAKAAQSLADLRQAQIQGKDVTAALNQAKFDFAQEAAAQAAALKDKAQQQANQIAQQKNVIDLNGQQVTQGDTRASAAASILNNSGNMALDVAKGGGTPGQIGNVLSGMLSVAPSFQQQMGGAPVAFTPDHFKDLVSLINSGTVQPDANGNVVPNALKQLAQQNGVLPGAGPVQAGWGPGNPDYDRPVAMGAGAGSGNDVSQPAQFTAPAAA